MAHSGGGKPLGQAAVSTYAFAKPTFLVLLDSQYGYYRPKKAGGPDVVRQFVDHWAGLGKLGLGKDESRVLIVSRIYNDSGTNEETISIRNGLRAGGHTVLEVSEPRPSGIKKRGDREAFPAAEDRPRSTRSGNRRSSSSGPRFPTTTFRLVSFRWRSRQARTTGSGRSNAPFSLS